MLRLDWDQIDVSTRASVEARTGPITSAETVAEGRNSELAAVLCTDRTRVFVKGLRVEHPGIAAHRREAAINPYVRSIAPELLWEVENAEWHLLGFEYTAARTADLAPRSIDLSPVVAAMAHLGELPCPDLPTLKHAEGRWGSFLDHPSDAAFLRGDTLPHTDYNPANLLIDGPVARIVDWAWPTQGAPWVDPACLVVQLVAAGHTPQGAEAVVSAVDAWRRAPAGALEVGATVLSRMWAEIAQAENSRWTRTMAEAAVAWRACRCR